MSVSEPSPTTLTHHRVIKPALFALRRIGLGRAWGPAQAIKGPVFAVCFPTETLNPAVIA